MKSLKSTLSVFAIASLIAGCAIFTDAPAPAEQPKAPTVITVADDAGFAGGNDVKPILSRPKI